MRYCGQGWKGVRGFLPREIFACLVLGKHNFEQSEAISACIYVSARSVKSSPSCIKILWGLAEAIVSHAYIPATLKFLYPIFEYTN